MYLISPNLKGHLGLHIFGVCDGHGFHGHKASEFVVKHFPGIIYKQIPNEMLHQNNITSIENLYSKLPFYLQRSFQEVHSRLIGSQAIETQLR